MAVPLLLARTSQIHPRHTDPVVLSLPRQAAAVGPGDHVVPHRNEGRSVRRGMDGLRLPRVVRLPRFISPWQLLVVPNAMP